MFKLIGIGCVALALLLPLKDGSSVSDAAKNKIAEQIPYSLEILAQRHPFKIGIIRAMLNDQGELDKFAKSSVRSYLQDEQIGLIDSYKMYYAVLFDADDVRKGVADSLEKSLDL